MHLSFIQYKYTAKNYLFIKIPATAKYMFITAGFYIYYSLIAVFKLYCSSWTCTPISHNFNTTWWGTEVTMVILTSLQLFSPIHIKLWCTLTSDTYRSYMTYRFFYMLNSVQLISVISTLLFTLFTPRSRCTDALTCMHRLSCFILVSFCKVTITLVMKTASFICTGHVMIHHINRI